MKTTIIALLASQAVSYGVISISGISGSGFGVTDVPAGALVLFVVDDGSNGFLGNPAYTGNLTSINDPSLLPANASTDLGSRFGGDMVFGRTAVTTAGQIPFTLSNFDQSFSSAPFNTAGAGRNFAIIWLQDNTIATTGNASGDYGIIRGLDWIIPSGDGTFTASATPATFAGAGVFARVTQAAGDLSNESFGTATPAFTLVPEPSAALLGALGALGLLRRRRN
jgi:MYXO-CTERM domain-containing protein